VPYLGVCLGAQLLAVVAGGTVGEVRNGPELGLVPLWPTADTEDDPLLHDLGAGTMALQWHFLEVHQLPVGSASLCRSEACPNQAFRVGPRAWGVQFHLEALAPTAEEWASGDLSQLADLGLDPQQLVAEVRAHEAQLASQWSTVADRWLGIVAEATENDR
jgi:GMP synthase-like glutamine amidotransferase